MANWRDLGDELDAWREKDTQATFWWRDDDATEPTGQLSRMLAIVSRFDAPLGLAVIPRTATPELRELLKAYPGVSILQHGFDHKNHAPPGEKSAELGDHREQDVLLRELTSGFSEIRRFDACQPVLVPPWNRIDPAILSKLPGIGYKGISTNFSRQTAYAATNLISIGAHADIIDWRGTREFVGTDSALDQVIEHLAARRAGKVDKGEPTGLLTHHLVHDEGCWQFIEDFLDRLKNHEGARLINISEALAL